MKRTISFFLLFSVLLTGLLTGCSTKTAQTTNQTGEQITLTFYGLFDNSEIYEPFIQSYETANPNVTILYKKFTDSTAYLDLIINELAEGEGPDIFMMHNDWFPKHYKKLTPAPDTIVNTEVFRSAFVDVTSDDLIIPDETGTEKVWGLPLYIDTLALFYNDDHFEEALPSQGAPSVTWEGIKNDVSLLNREDQSFERFERSGIAMGRSDNILRAFDIFMALLLQYKVDLYDGTLTEVVFDSDPNMLSALNLYTSFALPSQKNYSWNKYLADANSGEKELVTFAKGKLSMLLGYSFTYEDIINEINTLKAKGEGTIDINSVKIQEIPQVYDPQSSTETRKTYANYFVPVVSRTSKNQEEAWKFLASMVTEGNLRTYNQLTHRPSALRSLIKEQMQDPVYGVFATQVGYAHSIAMADATYYKDIFFGGIDQILDTKLGAEVIKNLASQIQALIPASGIKPIYDAIKNN
ncbi:MAG: extracellular solute-binding protein [Candidatus Gracilibacteria bacterium]